MFVLKLNDDVFAVLHSLINRLGWEIFDQVKIVVEVKMVEVEVAWRCGC